ncbi:hypothetical protein AAMO2058_000960700 [Amorphochlora amoebiformis]
MASSGKMTLFVDRSVSGQFLRAVAAQCQMTDLKIREDHKYSQPVLISYDPALQKELSSRVFDSEEALSLNYPRAIARYMARISNNAILLGSGPLEEALVDDLIAVALGKITGDVIKRLDQMTAKTTYLGSPSGMRLGDLAVFAAVHHKVESKKGSIDALPSNLLRWFNFMQHHHTLSGKVDSLPLIPVVVPPSPLFGVLDAVGGGKGKEKEGKGGLKEGKKGAGAKSGSKGPSPSEAGTMTAAEKKAAKKAAKKLKLAAEAKARAAKEIGRINIRAGRITSCEPAESDSTLYVSKVDLGAEGERKVVSRLGGFVPIENMRGSLCVLIANLPEADFGGQISQGRILCGTDMENKSKKSIVLPPTGIVVGERITFEGAENIEPDKIVKDKRLRPVMKKLNVSAGTAKYADLPFTSSKGPCTCPGIDKGTIA